MIEINFIEGLLVQAPIACIVKFEIHYDIHHTKNVDRELTQLTN